MERGVHLQQVPTMYCSGDFHSSVPSFINNLVTSHVQRRSDIRGLKVHLQNEANEGVSDDLHRDPYTFTRNLAYNFRLQSSLLQPLDDDDLGLYGHWPHSTKHWP